MRTWTQLSEGEQELAFAGYVAGRLASLAMVSDSVGCTYSSLKAVAVTKDWSRHRSAVADQQLQSSVESLTGGHVEGLRLAQSVAVDVLQKLGNGIAARDEISPAEVKDLTDALTLATESLERVVENHTKPGPFGSTALVPTGAPAPPGAASVKPQLVDAGSALFQLLAADMVEAFNEQRREKDEWVVDAIVTPVAEGA